MRFDGVPREVFRPRAYGLLIFNTVVAALLFFFHSGPVLANLENAFVDLRYWLRGLRAPDPRIVLVTIDDKSIGELGFFPWPRDTHARLIERLSSAGVGSMAFDLFFSEPDRHHAQGDAALVSSAVASGRTVLAVFFNRSPEGDPTDPIVPLESLQNDRVSMGMVNIFPEKDGATRRAPLWVWQNGTRIPSLALAAWSVAEKKSPDELILWRRPPVDERRPWNEAYLNYTYWQDGGGNRSPFPSYSYVDVLKGRIPADRFREKIVLIGATAPGLFDAKSAPGAPVIYGIEIHANTLNNLLRGNFFRTEFASGVRLFLTLVAFGGLAWLLMSRSSTFVGGATAVAVLVGYFYIGQLAFDRNVLLAYASPLGAFLLTYFSGLIYRLFIADREKEKMRQTWSRYMSPKLVDLLIAGHAVPTAGHREVTVFFSDLEKFTTLSEQVSPKTLVDLLNAYFSVMTDILFKYDITFDKYIGDSIMAYGNAPLAQPDHALQACRAALAQLAALPNLHKNFKERGWPPLEFRIGLHTGVVLYGDLGSRSRSNYTVMGDTVNLASRLEGANKFFGTRILLSETTYRAAESGIEARELDFLRVKGKQQPIRVYELVALKDDLLPPQRHGFSVFADALRLYRERRFDLAREEFFRVRAILEGDGPSELYVKRCTQFLEMPPPAEWDGVFVMTSK